MSAPAPGWLYVGRTSHARLKPFAARFTYPVYALYLDIDRLAEAARGLRLFGLNRFNLTTFRTSDHGARDGALRGWAEARFRDAGICLDGGAIWLLCLPRILGYAFKPLSVWFGYGPDGALRGAIYEVHNTFGEAHSYVAATQPQGRMRQSVVKTFHVSPFFGVDGGYTFTLRPPGEALSLVIEKRVEGAPDHVATWTGERRALSDRELLSAFLRMPFLSLQVIAGIHFEALKLWLKGARYHPKPSAPQEVATVGRLDGATTSRGESDRVAL
jgi:DUF1365 family protein